MPTKKITHSDMLKASKDHKRAAAMAHLNYVDVSKEGIKRIKNGKGYKYTLKGRAVTDTEQLLRIKHLAIPPSYKDVWISPSPNGHIQVTGIDLNGRKQYRYHSNWNKLRNDTKFHRLMEFGKSLPSLRKKITKDLSIKDLNAEKVLATAIKLMEQTYIRIGNNGYEKLYGSYGLTTLKDKHLKIEHGEARLTFVGKKGIDHDITLKDKRLARILKQCRDIPGKELFQYYDSQGKRHGIDSGMVNTYIKNATEHDFSAKDFRTWAGTLHAIQCFQQTGEADSKTAAKKNIVTVLDQVSSKLGNSRNICKKYYVHPAVIDLYENGKLISYLKPGKTSSVKGDGGLSPSEQLMMTVLKKCNAEEIHQS